MGMSFPPEHKARTHIVSPVYFQLFLHLGSDQVPDFPKAILKGTLKNLKLRLDRQQYSDVMKLALVFDGITSQPRPKPFSAFGSSLLTLFLGYRPAAGAPLPDGSNPSLSREWWRYARRACRDRTLYVDAWAERDNILRGREGKSEKHKARPA